MKNHTFSTKKTCNLYHLKPLMITFQEPIRIRKKSKSFQTEKHQPDQRHKTFYEIYKLNQKSIRPDYVIPMSKNTVLSTIDIDNNLTLSQRLLNIKKRKSVFKTINNKNRSRKHLLTEVDFNPQEQILIRSTKMIIDYKKQINENKSKKQISLSAKINSINYHSQRQNTKQDLPRLQRMNT